MQIYVTVLGERVVSMALLSPAYFFIHFCQGWKINIYRMECDYPWAGVQSSLLGALFAMELQRKEVRTSSFPSEMSNWNTICISAPLKHAGASSAKEFIYSVSFGDTNMRSGDESPGLCLVMDFIHRDSGQGISFIPSCIHQMIVFPHVLEWYSKTVNCRSSKWRFKCVKYYVG